ncbi:MAG: hypothetical protein AAGL68_09490 [Pseudomonadota bacterium]
MAVNTRSESFFFNITLVLIACIFAGFGSAALFLDQFVYPPNPLLVFHGVITLGWFVLTASQARMIRNSRFDLHRKMGAASVVLALLIVVTGYFVVKDMIAKPTSSIAGFTPAGSTIFPTMDLLGFVLFYILAIANRKTAAAHKRLIILAGMMMLPPATARLGLTIGFEPLPAVAIFGLVAAMLIYDWRTRGRPHWASVLGLIVGVGGTPVRFLLGPSDGWVRFAEALY